MLKKNLRKRLSYLLPFAGGGAQPKLDLNFTAGPVDPLITFTRASEATVFGGDGLMYVAAADKPRIDYDPATGECLGLLLEEARTNALTRSEEFDHSDWAKLNLNTTGMADVAVAPDGNTTADQLIEDGTTNGFWMARSQSFVSGTTYTFSAFYKDKTGDRFPELVFPIAAFTTYIIANFNLSTGACTISGAGTCAMKDVGNGWWRCSMTATATATNSASIQLRITNSYTTYAPTYAGNNASGVYVWGAQFEEGAFPTSYIPTVASTATRAADVASITGTNFSSWFNASEGTVFIDVRSSSTATPISHTLSDGTFNESIYGNFVSGTSYRGANVLDAGAGQAASIPTFTGIVQSVGIRDAFAYKLNDFAEALNGSAAVTDTSGTLPTVNRLYLGSNWAGNGNYLCGHIKRFTYYDTRLPNTTLREITA